MSNVVDFQNKLIMNAQFMMDFMDAEPPCFALGLVEERKSASGFLALRLGKAIPHARAAGGFRFGHALLGTSAFEVIQFSFEFYGFAICNVLLNPSNTIVQTVLTTMVESGDYFFFAINPDHSTLAFRSEFEQDDLAGLKTNLRRIQRSTTTPSQYDKALSQFERHPQPPGTLMNWVCRDDVDYLNLTDNPLVMNPVQ